MDQCGAEGWYFDAGNLTVLQTTRIPMGIDLASFWANLYLSKHKWDFMCKLIKEDERKSFMQNFDLLMIIGHLMIDENFKSLTKKFTCKN